MGTGCAPRKALSQSSILGKYKLVAELARGGMGVVYLGTSSGVGGFSKLHVIKELKPELVDDPGFVEMFLEEARLAARLNHPNIVPTHEVGIEGVRPFLVMEYLEGQTLARVLKKKLPAFTLAMHVRVIAHTLEGLHYAHTQEDFDGTRRSVVHRDVSPQNVFVTYDGQVKILDFGIAKASDSTVETRTGVFKGKPAYMSPEQLRGVVDPRGDVFAAGVMLWEALVGRRMWERRTDVEILTALLKGELPSVDEAAPQAHATLRAIVKHATSVDVEQRYATADQMRLALDDFLEETADRTTSRQLGEVLSTAFAARRAELRAVIDRCINAAKVPSGGISSGPINIAPAVDEPSAPSRARSLPSLVAAERSFEVTTSTLPSRDATPPSSLLTVPGDVRSLQPPPRTRRGWLVALAVVGLALLGGVVFLVGRASGTKGSEPTAAAGSVVTPAPPPTQAVPAIVTTTSPAPSAHVEADPDVSTASASKPVPPPPPRIVYVPIPARPAPNASVAPKAGATTVPGVAPATTSPDCNPPFYFDGTKKVFKPACL